MNDQDFYKNYEISDELAFMNESIFNNRLNMIQNGRQIGSTTALAYFLNKWILKKSSSVFSQDQKFKPLEIVISGKSNALAENFLDIFEGFYDNSGLSDFLSKGLEKEKIREKYSFEIKEIFKIEYVRYSRMDELNYQPDLIMLPDCSQFLPYEFLKSFFEKAEMFGPETKYIISNSGFNTERENYFLSKWFERNQWNKLAFSPDLSKEDRERLRTIYDEESLLEYSNCVKIT